MKYTGKAIFTSSVRSKIPKANPQLKDWKLAALKRIEANIRNRNAGGGNA